MTSTPTNQPLDLDETTAVLAAAAEMGTGIDVTTGRQLLDEVRRLRAAIARVLEFAASLDETGRQIAGPDARHPVAVHLRSLLAAEEAPDVAR
ncbi:hypothetical protein [Streptomyces sp. NPDC050534]|uniref:hypothetical protein n=1 Tax=Streptomyces sp. NPDC050534 TaxID=3365625 RepID=UPI00378CF4E9